MKFKHPLPILFYWKKMIAPAVCQKLKICLRTPFLPLARALQSTVKSLPHLQPKRIRFHLTSSTCTVRSRWRKESLICNIRTRLVRHRMTHSLWPRKNSTYACCKRRNKSKVQATSMLNCDQLVELQALSTWVETTLTYTRKAISHRLDRDLPANSSWLLRKRRSVIGPESDWPNSSQQREFASIRKKRPRRRNKKKPRSGTEIKASPMCQRKTKWPSSLMNCQHTSTCKLKSDILRILASISSKVKTDCRWSTGSSRTSWE